jgi:hypothetical protein
LEIQISWTSYWLNSWRFGIFSLLFFSLDRIASCALLQLSDEVKKAKKCIRCASTITYVLLVICSYSDARIITSNWYLFFIDCFRTTRWRRKSEKTCIRGTCFGSAKCKRNSGFRDFLHILRSKKPTSDLKDLISSYAYRIFRMIVLQDRTISSVFIFPKILSDSNYRMPVKILQDSDITKRLQLNCMINADLICSYLGMYDLTVSFFY